MRPEEPSDCDAIRAINVAAFATHPYSTHDEQDIVDALRRAHALTVSLVAVEGDAIVGHVACSPVMIDSKPGSWFGLGPIAVRPDMQGKGIGAALVRASIKQLQAVNADGIVLLGEPKYYERFGFKAHPELKFPGAPASHFLSLPLRPDTAQGVVQYHAAFGE